MGGVPPHLTSPPRAGERDVFEAGLPSFGRASRVVPRGTHISRAQDPCEEQPLIEKTNRLSHAQEN